MLPIGTWESRIWKLLRDISYFRQKEDRWLANITYGRQILSISRRAWRALEDCGGVHER